METQASICAWADETFGPASNLLRVLVRADEEMVELLRKLTAPDIVKSRQGRIDDLVEEAADVVIVLCRAAQLAGDNQFMETFYTLKGIDTAEKMAITAAAYLRRVMVTLYEAPGEVAVTISYCAGSLFTFCLMLGRSLPTAVEAKMAKNRARKWRRDGTGHGYHTQEAGHA